MKAMSEEDARIAMLAQTLPPLIVSLKKIDVINDLMQIGGVRVVAKGKRVAYLLIVLRLFSFVLSFSMNFFSKRGVRHIEKDPFHALARSSLPKKVTF